jgi:hypothetical protein|tara:strand:+ start:457 stop:735 length:279 start_codon:yes stop_codon:yes gene_type:complete
VHHTNAVPIVVEWECVEQQAHTKEQHFVQEQHGHGHQRQHLLETFIDQVEMHVRVIAVDVARWATHTFRDLAVQLLHLTIAFTDVELLAQVD